MTATLGAREQSAEPAAVGPSPPRRRGRRSQELAAHAFMSPWLIGLLLVITGIVLKP